MDFSISKRLLVGLCAVGAILGQPVVAKASFFDSIGGWIWNDVRQTETQILHVTSDALKESIVLNLLLDDVFQIEALRAYQAGKLIAEFSKENIPNGSVVIYRKDGHDVVTLKSKDFRRDQGGNIDMVYLSNAISGEYKTLPLNVTLEGQNWVLRAKLSTGLRSISSMYLEARKVFGQVVGIKNIEVR